MLCRALPQTLAADKNNREARQPDASASRLTGSCCCIIYFNTAELLLGTSTPPVPRSAGRGVLPLLAFLSLAGVGELPLLQLAGGEERQHPTYGAARHLGVGAALCLLLDRFCKCRHVVLDALHLDALRYPVLWCCKAFMC